MTGAWRALDDLEEGLWEEESHLGEEWVRLAQAWRQLEVALKVGRWVDEAAQKRHNKAVSDAKKICMGDARDAVEAEKWIAEVADHEETFLEQAL